MNDIIYLWYVRDLIDPRCVARPLAYYAPGRFFAWAPGEPQADHPFAMEVFESLEWMVMEGGVRWNGVGLASCNVREGRPFTFADLLPGMRRLLEATRGTGGHWSWERHGQGYALYIGRDHNMHGLNVVSAANPDAFDANGAAVRALIEAAVNAVAMEPSPAPVGADAGREPGREEE